MSAEDLRADMAAALKRAVADGADPDEIEGVLDEMRDRLDRIRALEGER